jgi:hypothetical protein
VIAEAVLEYAEEPAVFVERSRYLYVVFGESPLEEKLTALAVAGIPPPGVHITSTSLKNRKCFIKKQG